MSDSSVSIEIRHESILSIIMSQGEGVQIQTGDENIDNKIQEWLEWDRNDNTRREVLTLVQHNNVEKLQGLFTGRIEFGTAGLRGRMGAGYTQMNDLVIIQTGQGMVKYLLQVFEDTREKGVVIGYDGRYNSRRFAELTANILTNEGVKVYLFSDLCPTPFIPFTVTHYEAVAGIMITASHNPKDDNGYKVYWRNGAQIISPIDKEISELILQNLHPKPSSWQTVAMDNPLIEDPLATIMDTYYEHVYDSLVLFPDLNESSDLNIVYTPMHGVGYEYMKKAFQIAKLKDFIVVKEQKDPDPEFSTVKFPNPEEGKSALNLSIQTAEANNCKLILANDPDSDRLAVAELNETGQWKVFNGNELGALLGWYMFHCYKLKKPDISNYEHVYMMSSTVSSKILSTMAKKEGFEFEETLTGFKWMGNRAFDLIKENKEILLAYEEAIGFMCGTTVLDKDGISAGIKVAEMANYLHLKHNMSLQDKLADVYRIYGHHITKNSYFFCYQPDILKKIFHRLRNFFEDTDCSYPNSIMDGKYTIVDVRDLTTGYHRAQIDRKARLPSSKSSHMITFKFNNGLVFTLRTSGTEPKLKYYSELCADPSIQDTDELKTILQDMIDATVEEFLNPKENGLVPASD